MEIIEIPDRLEVPIETLPLETGDRCASGSVPETRGPNTPLVEVRVRILRRFLKSTKFV